MNLRKILENPLGVVALAALTVLAIFGAVYSIVYLFMPDDSVEEISRSPIVSLDRGTTINVNFSIGIGSVNSSPSYIYYKEIKPSVFKLGWVSSKYAVIVEEDRYDGELWVTKEVKDGVVTYKYEFHVPRDTVIRRFEA